MRRLALTGLVTSVAFGLVGAASASATVTPSCIPTSNTPFTVVVPGITTFTQSDVGIVMAPLSDPSQISYGTLGNETVSANGLTATAAFPAGLASGVYGVVAPVAETQPQFIDVGTITVGCGVTPHPTSTIVECGGFNPIAPGESALCTAIVTDTSAQPNTPTGTITLTSSAPALFSPDPCPTSSGGGDSTGCFARITSFAFGTQTITASYSGDSTHQPSSVNASVTVATSTNTRSCRVTFKGQVILPNGDRAHIAGDVRGTGPSGRERYRDRGPANAFVLASHTLSAVSCSGAGGTAIIFGTGSLSDGTKVSYRIDVTTGEHATYRIRISNGYDSGVAMLRFGNIDITRTG